MSIHWGALVVSKNIFYVQAKQKMHKKDSTDLTCGARGQIKLKQAV